MSVLLPLAKGKVGAKWLGVSGLVWAWACLSISGRCPTNAFMLSLRFGSSGTLLVVTSGATTPGHNGLELRIGVEETTVRG